MKTKISLLPLFMVFCVQFTHAQIPFSEAQAEAWMENTYDNILYSGVVYGQDEGDDGCWCGSVSRSSLTPFPLLVNNYADSTYGIAIWVPGEDDCDGYLYDTGPQCIYDGNNLGYDGMDIWQINWDESSPDPEMGEAFFRVGPYFSNSSFLFVNRIRLFIYHVYLGDSGEN